MFADWSLKHDAWMTSRIGTMTSRVSKWRHAESRDSPARSSGGGRWRLAVATDERHRLRGVIRSRRPLTPPPPPPPHGCPTLCSKPSLLWCGLCGVTDRRPSLIPPTDRPTVTWPVIILSDTLNSLWRTRPTVTGRRPATEISSTGHSVPSNADIRYYTLRTEPIIRGIVTDYVVRPASKWLCGISAAAAVARRRWNNEHKRCVALHHERCTCLQDDSVRK